MERGWRALLGLCLVVIVTGCGSGAGTRKVTGTELKVDGVATSVLVVGSPNTKARSTDPATIPDPVDIPDPADTPQVDISGTLKCNGNRSTGTGMYAVDAVSLCLQLSSQRAAFDQIADRDSDADACSEIYGGPQHVKITGAIDGAPVDVSVTRTNGCGIQDWSSLEWLLGPPER